MADFSIDGTTLLDVSNEDIVNGTFVIPDGVTTIGEAAFWLCENLTSITLPNSATNICDGAFFGCKNLTSLTLPDGVTTIGSGAFSRCENLKYIIVDHIESLSKFQGLLPKYLHDRLITKEFKLDLMLHYHKAQIEGHGFFKQFGENVIDPEHTMVGVSEFLHTKPAGPAS